MKKNDFAAIVLAAGEGKRMESTLPKVLHKVRGKSMILRTVETLVEIFPEQIIVVASPSSFSDIEKELAKKAQMALQKKPLGTLDAAISGLKQVKREISTVCVMYGDDTAFYKPQTVEEVLCLHKKQAATVTFVTLYKDNPEGLGRIVRTGGKLVAIVEERDATTQEKKVKEINDGLYFFEKKWLLSNAYKINPSKATGELYITDLIGLALKQKEKVETYTLPDADQWHGINTAQELESAQKKLARNIHIMGIGGAGAAAIAGIAKESGFTVSGCDLKAKSSYIENLKGIPVMESHSKEHLKDIDLLVVSPAVLKNDPKNLEVAYAKRLGIPQISWQKFQADYLQSGKFVIAVTGAFGKSTTTAMISQILSDAGLDPTCEVGAKVIEWNSNFRFGKSKYYVCEADEYNNNFLNYQPDVAVILNVAWDHPDFFKTEQSVFDSYKKFIGNLKRGGTLIIRFEPKLNKLNIEAKKGSDPRIVKIKDFGPYDLSIIGDFRKENANAALTVARVLGIDPSKAKKSVQNFKGLGRRLEFKGEMKGVKFYDDYAVQPYTVSKTTDALREKFKNQKLALVFEPHTFSRINVFFDDFVKVLKNSKADQILITSVYPARESGDVNALSQKLAKAVGKGAKFTGSMEKTAMFFKNHLRGFDVVCSMGAGDSYKLYDLVL